MKWSKHIRIIVMLSFLLGLLASVAAYAQDINFEARIDKTRMSFQDVLVLSLILSGGNVDMNVAPDMPDLEENFDILRGPSRSTSISIVNGRQSGSLVYAVAEEKRCT